MKTVFKKAIRISLCCCIAFTITISGLFFAIVQPGGSGLLASIQLPDGSEYRVTQRCNWSAEPYTVSFYMRSPKGGWGWCYIDHQATRWRDVALTYDATLDIVTVTEQGTWKAGLDRKRSTFAIGHGKPKRELDAPQSRVKRPEFASQ